MNSLVIRADGSVKIGTGHVMRCLALAQEWQRSGGVTEFAAAECTESLEQKLGADRIRVHRLVTSAGSLEDAAYTIALARTCEASWVVADGYCFGAEWQKQIKAAGFRLLLVDDCGQSAYYHADLVLNQNISAGEHFYVQREKSTRLLLGPRYALLRREFLKSNHYSRDIPLFARKVLVTLGGSDPENVTCKIIQALNLVPNVESVIVVGGSNPNLVAINALLANKETAIRVVVDATNMPELMAWADVAVAAGGSTSWELAFMGLPSLVLILAENQSGIAATLQRKGACALLGNHRDVQFQAIRRDLAMFLLDVNSRREMSRRAQELVDGLGSRRVVEVMNEIESGA
jgi:UDP-2,4-diacetamido-2,4,6-trideoxy-beta-L-altropyranose hydrolase